MIKYRHLTLTIADFTNNYLSVSVSINQSARPFFCRFLSGFVGTAKCQVQIYSNTSSRKQTFTSIDSGVVNSTLVIDICSYEFGLMLTHNFEVSLVDRSLDTLQVKIVGTFTSPSLNQTSSNDSFHY